MKENLGLNFLAQVQKLVAPHPSWNERKFLTQDKNPGDWI